MRQKIYYTGEAILALLKANETAAGVAYGKMNEFIPDKVVDSLSTEYQPLFRGKRWRIVSNAFIGSNGTLHAFAIERNLTVPSRGGRNRKVNYTAKAILALMKANEREEGVAYGGNTDVISDKVVDTLVEEYQPLFRGKKWTTVDYALKQKKSAGVTTRRDFAIQHNLQTPKRGARRSLGESDRTVKVKIWLSKAEADEALLAYAAKNEKKSPISSSGIVEDCSIADGKLTWDDVSAAFPHRVNGVDQTMQAYAMSKLGLVTIYDRAWHNLSKAAEPEKIVNPTAIEKTSEAEKGNNGHKARLYRPAEDFLIYADGSSGNSVTVREVKIEPLEYRSVFRVVALQILKAQGYSTESRKVLDITKTDQQTPARYGEPIKHNLPHNPLIAHGYSWQQMVDEARSGNIPEMPENFNLAVFAEKVSQRFASDNYSMPEPSKVAQWMIVPLRAAS